MTTSFSDPQKGYEPLLSAVIGTILILGGIQLLRPYARQHAECGVVEEVRIVNIDAGKEIKVTLLLDHHSFTITGPLEGTDPVPRGQQFQFTPLFNGGTLVEATENCSVHPHGPSDDPS